ncbi:GreA/GreB family elongation factor [Psychrosphaera sp. B3R10]|uniref:GreA/GreB family elongation factor n=1 Tax=Psychrosphaera algicola TaxID=3023714 RepID=A0ABT5FED5_9GAMM|nr:MULTISPECIES: GreA/GreB family elongation factor [unclassified Psychrosphaera]MBU2882478.1 GreA/GreB family elongation factor [Psychrosphaera sp. I2R16]MBU2990299.1 GreA/GreB family elongation factor [Psychrosphaera sp. B3R10]MDC2889322.1 GreA/GreB family elongation factor [Psychrosphaera sp. G1-22]MDO6721259.1 GreA/GreB family elongation factor [Psychrosphaera sp. 1_MG-2023]
MHIDKQELIQSLIAELQQSLLNAVQAAKDAHDLATHDQSKAETQYDTVAIEAAYLAEGQSKRVEGFKQAIADWKMLKEKSLNGEAVVNVGSLVCVENEQEQVLYYLLGNEAGGLKLQFDDKCVTVISVLSPIGKALLGKEIDDEVQFKVGNETRLIAILEIH